MYVQIIEFDVEGLTRAEYETFCSDAVGAIAQIPGVVAKLFLADADGDRCAGVYTFSDRESAHEYLRSDLFRTAIVANPTIANIRTSGAELLEGPTRALDAALAA
jgi:hypothetical protein